MIPTPITEELAGVETTGQQRAAKLELLLGDPHSSSNRCGYQAVLEADSVGGRAAGIDEVLDQSGHAAEYVPVALGGRFRAVDELIYALRPVFARDAAHGLGYGVTTLMAAMNVWTAGDLAQQRDLAAVILSGKPVSVAFHELAHGNDLFANESRAERSGDAGLALYGRKDVINNAAHAARSLVYARTDAQRGPRSHTLLLIEPRHSQGIEVTPRRRTSAGRGCDIAGYEFSGFTTGTDTVIGGWGRGAEIALRAFQVTRCVTAGVAIATLGSILNEVTEFASTRTLYRQKLIEIPHARTTLVNAAADIAICDALAITGARLLHLHPDQGARYAAAVKYLVPLILEDTAHSLGVLLGARVYLRTGSYAIVGKHLRDIPVLSIGHAGGTACLMTIIPQLTAIGRRAAIETEIDCRAFGSEPLTPFNCAGLSLAVRGTDPLLCWLAEQLASPADAHWSASMSSVTARLARHLEQTLSQCRELQPASCGPAADPGTFRLAERYALLVAAACALGSCRLQIPGFAFRHETYIGWQVRMLERLCQRLDGQQHTDDPHTAEPTLLADLLASHPRKEVLT